MFTVTRASTKTIYCVCQIMNKKIIGPVVFVIIPIHLALPSTINYLLLLLHFFLQCLKLLPGQDMNLFIFSSISCINMAYSTDAAKYQNIKRNDLSTNPSQFNVQVGLAEALLKITHALYYATIVTILICLQKPGSQRKKKREKKEKRTLTLAVRGGLSKY